MNALANITGILLPLLYGGALAAYAVAFFGPEGEGAGRNRAQRPLLLLALLAHTFLIYAETKLRGHCLVYTPFEMLTLVAFTVTLTYTILETTTGERGTGMFFLALALLLQVGFAMGTAGPKPVDPNPELLKYVVGLHISGAIIGYTAFAVGAVYGVLYLLMYRKIRTSEFGPFFRRLPSLQLMERLSAIASIVGVVFLGAAIVLGLFVLPDQLPEFAHGDPKMVVTIIVWCVYVAALIGRGLFRLDGRRTIQLSLAGFLGATISMTVINMMAGGR